MKNNVGLWIDHRRAVIVSLSGDGECVREMISPAGNRVRVPAGGRDPDGRRYHRSVNRLNAYYDRVIAVIHDAGAILILGPGDEKLEFEKRLKAESPGGGYIAGIETVDRMSKRQIAAKVRRQCL